MLSEKLCTYMIVHVCKNILTCEAAIAKDICTCNSDIGIPKLAAIQVVPINNFISNEDQLAYSENKV